MSAAPQNRVEIFGPSGVIVTLPTFRPVGEAKRCIDLRFFHKDAGFGWRYIDSTGKVSAEFKNERPDNEARPLPAV